MAKISFIIPVYNVDKYLRRCLESVRNQTEPDFEAILVDDGSTDASGDICKEFARLDSRFIYHHQENSWVAAARNAGLALVKSGEYISFVDSDDYIDPDFIEILYARAKEARADILVFGHKRNNRDNVVCEAPLNRIVEPNDKSVLEHFCRDWLHAVRQNYVWSKLYRRDFIDSAQAGFATEVRAGEDRNFLYKILYRSKRTVYVSETPYFYYQHSKSLTRSTASEERFFRGYLESYRDISDHWSKNGFHTFDPVKPIVLIHALRSAFFNVKRALVDLEPAVGIATKALRDFPFHEEFEVNKLKNAIKVYSDICGLDWGEQSKLWLFALSLLEGKEGILTWQRAFPVYSEAVHS